MDYALLEDTLVLATRRVGIAVYDFDFELHFKCRHPPSFDEGTPCVLRIGAVEDYSRCYSGLLELGLHAVNSPAEYARASELEHWYPLLSDLTPRTRVFDALPGVEEIESEFAWPIFLKGSRQTNRHNAQLSVIRDREQYAWVAERYRRDPVLSWQRPAVREFVPLQPVAGGIAGKVPASMEFRSFWWQGECLGWGRYWYQAPAYTCGDIEVGLALAGEAARRLAVPFLVVDIAKTVEGRWIVIECNDAQESGYAAASPQAIWRALLERMCEPARLASRG
ncbi:ATP-grasp domain-containing protein [Lysobacter sp. BMK333-48F3]|uniref:ATP-grasp domain-containing protein n=1 Tax=Lysobacter sp. BMK333-48F3 TaxID=2867962 RepID=UPI001C8B4802|nr:ATP-grasp domain-containing protein [Lysobacter sp. BMK333-48F3]MBX9400270.1 ATP-grasp domain-containing protein [Lysobacter sp. BMK333-48F3]